MDKDEEQKIRDKMFDDLEEPLREYWAWFGKNYMSKE